MELDCGIGKARIDAWLRDELALGCEGGTADGWLFSYGGGSCAVTTRPLAPRPLGTLALERTALRIEGDAPAVDEFQRLFTLRFASAGG